MNNISKILCVFCIFCASTFADENEERGRGRGRQDDDYCESSPIPETGTYAAIAAAAFITAATIVRLRKKS